MSVSQVVPDTKRWTEAIAAYEHQTEKLKQPFRAEFEQILEFATGPGWGRVLRLLNASGENITIGCEDTECVSPNYFLGPKGFFKKVKSEAEGEEIEVIFLFDSKSNKEESVSSIARAFRNKLKGISFNDFIYTELNRIAEEAFRQKK